jgi:hypothetical protein
MDVKSDKRIVSKQSLAVGRGQMIFFELCSKQTRMNKNIHTGITYYIVAPVLAIYILYIYGMQYTHIYFAYQHTLVQS